MPDFFDLRGQVGAGPAINPGTVQAHLPELYGKGTIYDVKKLRNRGWFIHAPCGLSNIRESRDSVTFVADGWGDRPYYVLISGIEEEPGEVSIREVAEDSAKKEFYSERNILVIALEANAEIRIR